MLSLEKHQSGSVNKANYLVSSVKYLFFGPLCCSWYSVVVFMFHPYTAHIYNFWSVRQKTSRSFSCFWADHLLQSSSGFSQIVFLSFKETLMLFEVILTVRVQTTSDRTWRLWVFLPVQTSHWTSPAPAGTALWSLVFFSVSDHFS